jgi:DNA-binding beta-propeller fold protein YncE
MWMRTSTYFFAVLLFIGGCAQSGRTAGWPEGSQNIVFSEDILPLLQDKFQPLLSDEDGLRLDSWHTLIAGSKFGEVLIPFDAERSLLIELAEHHDSALTQEEIRLVRAWIDAGARNDDGEVPYADADQLLYVCNQGAGVISVIDMESNLVIRTVDLQDFGYSENAKPHHVAVAGDGSYWYVSLIGENTVLKLSRENDVIGRVPFEVPGMLALSPDEEYLYVGRSMSALNPPHRIGIINNESLEIEEIDVFFPRPHALSVTPDGQHVYTASLAVNQMASLDTETLEVDVIDITGQADAHHHMPMQFEITPDGRTMIVGGEMSGDLLFFDLTDPMNPAIVETLNLGGSPWNPAITPDGRFAYVPLKRADSVAIVDIIEQTESAIVTGHGLSEPDGSAVRPDGRYVYVTNSNLDGSYTPRHHSRDERAGTVVVIDTSSNEIVKVLEVESNPTGIGTRPAR